MQERRRFVSRGKPRETCILANLQFIYLGLHLWTSVTTHSNIEVPFLVG